MSSIPINLEIISEPYELPRFEEKRGQAWVSFGENNRYDDYLYRLKEQSAMHGAIVDGTSKMIAGDGLVFGDNDLASSVEFQRIADKQLIQKTALDLKLFGNFYWCAIWSLNGIASVEHVPVRMCRAGVCDEEGKIETYYIGDFSEKKPETQAVPAYDPNAEVKVKQIYHGKLYDPQTHYYGTPDYIGAVNWIEVDIKSSQFHNSNLDNGMFPGWHIAFKNGKPEPEAQVIHERKILGKFSGANNAGKTIITWNNGAEETPEFNALESNGNHEMFQFLSEVAPHQILSGHKVTTPLLFGLRGNDGFGSNSDEMRDGFDIYSTTVIEPMQDYILTAVKEMLYNKAPKSIEIAQRVPKFLREEAPKELVKQELSAEASTWLIDQGEEVGDDWEELESMQVDYELDHDLNTELEGYHAFARTVRSEPGKESEQDTSIFKVRYRYAGRTEPNSREFCKRMSGAGKVYRKEDILKAEDQSVNPGWGAGGSNTYSIWEFKGGGGCQHFWERVIYLKKGGKVSANEARKIIRSLPVAERAAAKWEVNDPEVAKRTRDLPNKGFLPGNPQGQNNYS